MNAYFYLNIILRAGLEGDIRLVENRDDDNPGRIIEKMYATIYIYRHNFV